MIDASALSTLALTIILYCRTKISSLFRCQVVLMILHVFFILSKKKKPYNENAFLFRLLLFFINYSKKIIITKLLLNLAQMKFFSPLSEIIT